MSTKINLKFHHFGLATRDADETRCVLSGLGYELSEPLFDPLQNVNLIWCEHETMPAIEVVYPADTPGPLDPYLADYSEMVYHLCYVADSIQSAVDELRAAGLRVLPVAAPKPAVLFSGRHVGFYMAKGLGLIEILEDK
ncbi:MAG: VOC family protein [Gammaproteobacteria bacterium]|nr:VOC family protein [Gammaproteobacteria bacterium]MDH3372273.1 VOC family protein [Gammaproteobacteria bacterium]